MPTIYFIKQMVYGPGKLLSSQLKKTRSWSRSWKSYQNWWLMCWHYCNKVLPSQMRTTILMHLHQPQGHWKALLLPGAPKLHEQYSIHALVMTGEHKAVTDQTQGSRLWPKWLHYFEGLHELNFYTVTLVHVHSGCEVRVWTLYPALFTIFW